MTRRPPRAAPALRAGALVAGVAALLGWAAGSPLETWRTLVSAVASTPTAGFDQLLENAAALAAWVGLGWLCIAAFLEVAGTLPGAAGRGCAAIAATISPMLVRRIVQAVIGISVLAGPMTAGPAFATGPSTTTSTSAQVDRPVSPATPAVAGPSHALPDLDRPAIAFVPLAPPSATRPSTGRATLVTGTAHRDAVDRIDRSSDSYVVRRGDTLWDIAARHLGPTASAVDISRAWPAWYDANRAAIGPDPSVIRPGEVLVAPSTSTAATSTAAASTAPTTTAPTTTASTSSAPVGTR